MLFSCISEGDFPWSPKGTYMTVPAKLNGDVDQLKPRQLARSNNAVRAVTIALDKFVVYGGCKEIRVFAADTGAVVTNITGNFGWVSHLSVVHGATTLIISGHEDGVIRAWDLFGEAHAPFAAVPEMELSGHFNKVTSTAVIQGANPLVVSGSLDGTLRLWDLELGEPVAFSFHRRGPTFDVLFQYLLGTDDLCSSGVTSVEVSFQQEPVLVASGDENGEVFIWSVSFPSVEPTVPLKKGRGQVAKMKPSLKACCSVKNISIPVSSLFVLEKSSHLSSRLLLVARQDGSVCVRLMDTAELLYSVVASGSSISRLSASVVPALAPSPASKLDSVLNRDHRIIFITAGDESVCVWDAVNCCLLASCWGHTGSIADISVVDRRVKRPTRQRELKKKMPQSIFSISSMLQVAGILDPSSGSDCTTSSDEDCASSDGGELDDEIIPLETSPVSFEEQKVAVRPFDRDDSRRRSSPSSSTSSESPIGCRPCTILSCGTDGRLMAWELHL